MGGPRLRRPGNAISSAAPAPEAVEGQRLAAGAPCRIYRDGGVQVAQLTVPTEDGVAMVVRSLPPGRYVARDEAGGEAVFEVSPGQEEAVIQAAEGDELEAVDPALVGDDAARVPGAAGAGVQVEEEHVPLPDRTEAEQRAVAVAAADEAALAKLDGDEGPAGEEE